MKALYLSAAMAGISALLAVAPANAQTQQVPGGGVLPPPILQPGSGSLYPGSGSLYPNPNPPQAGTGSTRSGVHRGPRRGFNGGVVLFEEPEVIHDVVVVHDQAAEQPAPPPPPPLPRKPYVLGRSYSSLPGGCLKMIVGGASYFQCSGEWYRQVGAAEYEAVEMP
ncbi:MAG TPA: hypothetical protein VK192_07570 [Sphingomicrobium sp.]|jgi:hypothetical protein|nr:hypothetical protein [Sphingomicrobium sp.]